MKRVLLVSLGLIAMASYAGCLPEESTTVTGTGATAGTSPAGMAGSTGQAGSDQTGGTGGSDQTGGTGGGDQTGGTGGATSTAGTGGTGGGTAGTGGGTAGRGGTGGGTAGTGGGTAGRGGTGGGTAGTGGGTAGRGGTGGGTAGTGGGTAGTGGGTAGRGGSGGGAGGLPTIPDLFPTSGTQGGVPVGSFDGRLITMPCGDDNPNGTDCGGGGGYLTTAGSGTATRIACSGTSFTANHIYNVGGEAGRTYTVTVHFYGVSEPKQYCSPNANSCATNMVTKDAGPTGRPANTPTGATNPSPSPYATAPGGHTYPGSDYNTAEVRVCRTRACATADETTVHYLNADTREGHWTYVINYTKQIQVIGGGSIRVRNYDRNCREIKNCGPEGTAATACATAANARLVSTTGASPAPAAGAASAGGLSQPNLDPARPAGSSGQWLLIDVVSVDSVQ